MLAWLKSWLPSSTSSFEDDVAAAAAAAAEVAWSSHAAANFLDEDEQAALMGRTRSVPLEPVRVRALRLAPAIWLVDAMYAEAYAAADGSAVPGRSAAAYPDVSVGHAAAASAAAAAPEHLPEVIDAANWRVLVTTNGLFATKLAEALGRAHLNSASVPGGFVLKGGRSDVVSLCGAETAADFEVQADTFIVLPVWTWALYYNCLFL